MSVIEVSQIDIGLPEFGRTARLLVERHCGVVHPPLRHGYRRAGGGGYGFYFERDLLRAIVRAEIVCPSRRALAHGGVPHRARQQQGGHQPSRPAEAPPHASLDELRWPPGGRSLHRRQVHVTVVRDLTFPAAIGNRREGASTTIHRHANAIAFASERRRPGRRRYRKIDPTTNGRPTARGSPKSPPARPQRRACRSSSSTPTARPARANKKAAPREW